MSIIIRPSDKLKKAKAEISKLTSKKKLDVDKYCGLVKVNENPLDYQRRMRTGFHCTSDLNP